MKEKRIRFIDANYRTLFLIPDGGGIRIIDADGRETVRECHYIDEYHFRCGNMTYHICQFAERMKKNGTRYVPVREPRQELPYSCHTLDSAGNLVLVIRGEKRYERDLHSSMDQSENRTTADCLNGMNGVTKAEEAAMWAGCLFGWDLPAARPDLYDENGIWIANTMFYYMYRDGGNYKTHYHILLKGVMTDEMYAGIQNCLSEGEWFIPEQIGLDAAREYEYDPDMDHPWCEVEGYDLTRSKPASDAMTVADLAERFKKANEEGWDSTTSF